MFKSSDLDGERVPMTEQEFQRLICSVANRPHPETRPGEVYHSNQFPGNTWLKYPSTRLGDVAYDIFGQVLGKGNNARPVFVSIQDLEADGRFIIEADWEIKGQIKRGLAETIVPRLRTE